MKSLAYLELSYMATSLTVASKKSGTFFEVFWVVFGFCCNPLGLWVSDPSPRVEDGWGGRWKVCLCVDLEDVWFDLKNFENGLRKQVSLRYFLGCFWFWWGFLWSQVGDPTPGVENRVDRNWKINLCVDLEDVWLDLNHLKMGSGNRSFFGWLLGSCRVPWGDRWRNHLSGWRTGWADAEIYLCVRILRMYN